MISLLGLAGIIISSYAVYVEKNAHLKKKFLCDINENMSCSRILTSDYSKMVEMIFKLKPKHPLNLPNTYYGILFYIIVTLYPHFQMIPFREYLFFTGSLLSMLASITLICILIFKLKELCIVCLATHLINMCIFYLALKENSLIS
ncbi:MAG: putative vitamin K epoxide reductase complex subunit 1 [Harvfovirus sp.]|uniref:vitamin-K-epoxide reductase (warfarin-sensitive) n=1 Tax=Harvfovirus sp. TaxID=2487768 RepID=A0A3G5A1Y0_9VIRU|nr:MAG: putative vitamin K epoxide reductase complex subunit 1 [Harvfovirus sp.]